jgi:hypothetical protein
MPFYEIAIDCKGADAPVVSPNTYDTLEEAEAALAPFLEMLKSKGCARLSWFGAEAANVRQALVRKHRSEEAAEPADAP